MSNSLTIENIDSKIRQKIYQQDYSPGAIIEGVKIVSLKNYVSEDGDFSELIRIGVNKELENFSGFSLAQINRSRLEPNTIKGWHLHFRQDEIWYVSPSDRIFAGIWDVRESSKTKGLTMRLILGAGNVQLLFIPKGVAHGSVNFAGQAVELLYFVNQAFDINNPDEKRIVWDALGGEFWIPKRD